MKIIKLHSWIKWKIGLIINPIKISIWQKRFGKCGYGLQIYGSPKISFPDKIVIGNNVSLNDGSVLNATMSHIEIGNNCTISSNAQILAASYDVNGFLNYHNTHHISKPIVIGDNVWVCAGAIICPGVHILGGVIIAAGAVVTKDITEKNVVVAGNPAKIVKRICEG